MKTLTKPYVQVPPPARIGWHYDNYFLEQLAKIKHKPTIKRPKITAA
jgi:hypothetical protein